MEKAIVFLLISILVLGLIAGMISFVVRSIRKAKGYIETTTIREDGQKYIRPNGCCGRHSICERDTDTITNYTRTGVIYFDDEELDVYRGTPPNSYSPEAVTLFREVFETMCPSEVPQWLHSLSKREIMLPETLHDEVYSQLPIQAESLSAPTKQDKK